MTSSIRVRFAPSPTGSIHIGNVRAALFNYLFARQKKGKFIIRIEDTDQVRNVYEAEIALMRDLRWLGLDHDEGPDKEGPHAPYFQSQRTSLYQEKLNELINDNKVYRCFCTLDELERKRAYQLAQKLPPRYDRTCLDLSDDMVKANLVAKKPFIWRLKLNDAELIEIVDLARGAIKFDLSGFSDVALTRPDGSFTFMFTNCVDDWLMEITHVIRGEDHLTNTAMQAAIYDAFAVKTPAFLHLPLLIAADGRKLSKRDFGGSLNDLRSNGFLPQAICNYLALIGASLGNEIQSLAELIASYDFEHFHATGAIKFDEEKLRWVNHKWLQRLDGEHLLPYVKPFLIRDIPDCTNVNDETLIFLIDKVKSDLTLCSDFGPALSFFFKAPTVSVELMHEEFGKEIVSAVLALIDTHLSKIDTPELFLESLKHEASHRSIKPRALWGIIRYILAGKFNGIAIHELLTMISTKEALQRLHSATHLEPIV